MLTYVAPAVVLMCMSMQSTAQEAPEGSSRQISRQSPVEMAPDAIGKGDTVIGKQPKVVDACQTTFFNQDSVIQDQQSVIDLLQQKIQSLERSLTPQKTALPATPHTQRPIALHLLLRSDSNKSYLVENPSKWQALHPAEADECQSRIQQRKTVIENQKAYIDLLQEQVDELKQKIASSPPAKE